MPEPSTFDQRVLLTSEKMSYSNDPFEKLHYDMVRAHQTFKLGYDTILKNLDKSQETIKSDLPNFLGYCQAWSVSINAHHDSEEAIVFPFLNEKMNFESEQEAHKIIHKGITDFDAVIMEAKAEPSKYNPELIKEILVKLKDPLFEHLDKEVEHIKPSGLRNAGFVDAELKDLTERLDKYVQSHGDAFLVVPYMRSHTPPDLKDIWPPMPWVLRKVVIPYILAWKHSGYWKYSPYSVS